MAIDIEKTIKEALRNLPPGIKAAVITRDGQPIYTEIEPKTLKQILKIYKKHRKIQVNDYESDQLDENNLVFYALSTDRIFIALSPLSVPEIIVHSRKTIQQLQQTLNKLLKNYLNQISQEINEETKQKYNTIYTISPKYKNIEELLPLVAWMGETTATIVANLDKKLPIWQLTLLLQKAGINITPEQTRQILEQLRKHGYVTTITK
jgi:DNA-directed RNA polymerase subunit F